MRYSIPLAGVALALLALAVPLFAASPVPVRVGRSRDGALQDLQHKVDLMVGPGRVNVQTDFLGARAGDADPWFWINPGRAIQVTLVDRKSPSYVVGWYNECGADPAIDGVDDGLVLDRVRMRGMRVGFQVPRSVSRFGFYLTQTNAGVGPSTPKHCTNRTFNAPGCRGQSPEQAPFDGDPQMLVYDISRWAGPQTWLVACEIDDAGMRMGVGEGECDHDYSDVVFTVSGVAVTPTLSSTFGKVKQLYH
jgi:hypothetical protein